MRKDEGQSLIEVLVALAVMVIVILALVQITTVSIRNATFAKNQASATKYAQALIEKARKLRDEDEESFFIDGSCDMNDTLAIFSRARTCELNGDTMTVVVTVEWTGGSKIHQAKLETNLTKWK